MAEKYLIFNFKFPEGDPDVLTAFLLDGGFDGVEEVSQHEINAYLLESKYTEALLLEIEEKLYFSIDYSHEPLPDKNWNEEWESNFDPVIIDDFCIVRADFHKGLPDADHVITINPKLAFGTGHHMTTYMMIQAMRDMDIKDKAVLDLGTGTAILAILAEKLGAAYILATDNDEKAIENSIENIEANDCHKIQVEDHLYPLEDHSGDVVIANINMNVLIEYQERIEKAAKIGGTILLSGFLYDQALQLIELYTASGNLKLVAHDQGEEWNFLTLERV